ncbi:glycosyltransferase family 64 protein C4 [Papaver somniferum]|nr:glycosyltransferase family 64 protein C4 [Papaver somniferum]
MRAGSIINRRKFRQLGISIAVLRPPCSRRIEILLICFCISFSIFLFTICSTYNTRQQHYRPLRKYHKGYTLLMNTWKRNDLLKQSISHYTSCAGLDSIHIVWSEPERPSDFLLNSLQHAVQSKARGGRNIELQFDINKENSLNNRFKEIKELKTDAIFSIDDDVIFPCTSVELAFNVWQSAPETMVGFVPRLHLGDEKKQSLSRYTYGGWLSVWWMGTYSMVLSKASFFHKKYLGLYTNQMPASIRDYVTKIRNCEDIAMSFLVANETGAPPIWVKGKIFEIGSTGISGIYGHTKRRSECLNKFAVEYGRMPLVSTSTKAVDGRDSWIW